MKEDQAAFCAECQAVDPWVEENDERICRQCGYIQDGLEAAKFHHEDQYVNPLVDIYLKNPAFQNPTGGPSKRNRYGTEVSQRVQSRTDLFNEMDGCVRNTLGLPNIISHRAWNMLEIILKKRGKKNVTQGMKLLALSVTLVAAREAGHAVPNSLIASLTRRSLADIQSDVRLICKHLDLRYEEYRGASEETQAIVSAASEIAQQYEQKNSAVESVPMNKEFTSTLHFCRAFRPQIHLIDGSISHLQRFIQLTGIWHRRKLDICDIATVFIALQLIAVKYIRYPTFFMNDFRKYVNFNPETCQLRMREFHRMTMDLAFYLPQIGKARFIPELLEPWNGRTTRPVPEAQLFVLLLPDVLDNMQELWQKRLHQLTLQKQNPETIDVEARLKTAISAFLSPPDDPAMLIRTQSEECESLPPRADGDESAYPGNANPHFGDSASPPIHVSPFQLAQDTPSPQEEPLSATAAPSTSRGSPETSAISIKAASQQPNLETASSHECSDGSSATPESLTVRASPARRKRKLDGTNKDERTAKRVDRQTREYHTAITVPPIERRVRGATLDELKERITTRRANDLVRQQSRQERSIGLLAEDHGTSARAAYGHGILAHSRRTRLLHRIPRVSRILEEWQSAQLAEPRTEAQQPTPPSRSCYEYDAYWLKKDLRDGKAPSTINIHRFPPSVTMAKAMLYPSDFDRPSIGPEDDSLFEPEELESYLGDSEYAKCRLELWHSQGMEESAARRAAVRQRALDIASQRQPKITELRNSKRSKPNYDLGRMTELLASLRDDQDDTPHESDSYIAGEVGQALSVAVKGGAEEYDLGSHYDYSRSDSGKEDDVSINETSEKPDDEGLEIIGDYDIPPQMLLAHHQHDDWNDGNED